VAGTKRELDEYKLAMEKILKRCIEYLQGIQKTKTRACPREEPRLLRQADRHDEREPDA
jgi:hypothetical protein